jgi:hypothetical protein
MGSAPETVTARPATDSRGVLGQDAVDQSGDLPAGFVVTEVGTGSGEHRDVDTVPG